MDIDPVIDDNERAAISADADPLEASPPSQEQQEEEDFPDENADTKLNNDQLSVLVEFCRIGVREEIATRFILSLEESISREPAPYWIRQYLLSQKQGFSHETTLDGFRVALDRAGFQSAVIDTCLSLFQEESASSSWFGHISSFEWALLFFTRKSVIDEPILDIISALSEQWEERKDFTAPQSYRNLQFEHPIFMRKTSSKSPHGFPHCIASLKTIAGLVSDTRLLYHACSTDHLYSRLLFNDIQSYQTEHELTGTDFHPRGCLYLNFDYVDALAWAKVKLCRQVPACVLIFRDDDALSLGATSINGDEWQTVVGACRSSPDPTIRVENASQVAVYDNALLVGPIAEGLVPPYSVRCSSDGKVLRQMAIRQDDMLATMKSRLVAIVFIDSRSDKMSDAYSKKCRGIVKRIGNG
jgi:hypothetical protein